MYIITLDGPAGVGKSTLAQKLSAVLKIPYLNTGAMFRTLAQRIGSDGADLSDEELRQKCDSFVFTLDGEDSHLCCNGEEVGSEIATEEVGRIASHLAARIPVRETLKVAQRRIGESCSLVAEGRDMGTVIFPKAQFKFFIEADADIRAQRRFYELKEKGENVSLDAIALDIKNRDAQDKNRSTAPLRPAKDAILVDTSHRTIDEVVAYIISKINKRVFSKESIC